MGRDFFGERWREVVSWGISRAFCGTPLQSRLERDSKKRGQPRAIWRGLALSYAGGRKPFRTEFRCHPPSRRFRRKARYRRSSPARRCRSAYPRIAPCRRGPAGSRSRTGRCPRRPCATCGSAACPRRKTRRPFLACFSIISTRPSWKVTMRCHSVRSTLSPEFFIEVALVGGDRDVGHAAAVGEVADGGVGAEASDQLRVIQSEHDQSPMIRVMTSG